VFVDWVFGGVLLLVITWAAMLAWSAWVHSHALRKEVWQARGLKPGVILLAGVAEPIEAERHDAEHDALFAPFVELTIRQRGEERSSRNGRYVLWTETSRSLRERPFLLRTDAGTLVRVEPSGRIELVDRLEPPRRQGVERQQVAKIAPGDRIWVRGVLTSAGARDGGPYRGEGSSGSVPHTLRPGRDRPLFISSQPVESEERATARLHGLFGAGLLTALILSQLGIFGSYRALRSRGVPGTAYVERVVTWITRNKNETTTHWGLDLTWNVDGLAFSSREEVNPYIAGQHQAGERGPSAPIVYDPRSPGVIEVGWPSEIGVTDGQVALAFILSMGTLVTWLVTSYARRPWWRRKRLNERQSGTL